jgi:hypothetical protein
MLNMPGTLPVTTRVVTGRVAGMYSKSNILWTLVLRLVFLPRSLCLLCRLGASNVLSIIDLAFSVGRTVLGIEPLSIFLLPNMPLVGFEPVSLSHLLNMPATLPFTTVVTSRVAGMFSICDKDNGSNPTSGMFGERNMDRGSNPSTVLSTENAKSILESTLLAPNRHNRQGERGRNINLRTSVQRILLLLNMPATLPVTPRVLTGKVASMFSTADPYLYYKWSDKGLVPIVSWIDDRKIKKESMERFC